MNCSVILVLKFKYFSLEIHFSFSFCKLFHQSFVFLCYMSIILDNYFHFYKFSYQSLLFLYYISFDTAGLACVISNQSVIIVSTITQQYHHTVMW